MKRFFSLVLVGQQLAVGAADALALDQGSGAATQVVTPAYVNLLAEQLRTNSPAMRAADARAQAAEAGLGAVRGWEDPTITVGGMFADEEMRREDGDLLYGWEQKLPLFGRPAAARRLAASQLEVARSDTDLRFQMLRRDLARALFRAALADRVVEIGEQDLSWIEATLAIAEHRYQIGEGLQAQVLRLQNERALGLDRVITDRRRRDQTRAVLDRILGLTNRLAWPRLELPEPASLVEFNEGLVALSTRFEPRLKLLNQIVTEADGMVDVARRMRQPEFTVGGEARNSTRDGDFRQAMVTVAMNLPWLNGRRYRSDIRREEARRHAAQLDAVDYALGIREELQQLVVAADAARRQAILYRDEIIPRSLQALASTEAAWMTSRAAFVEVLEARRMVVDARLMYARAVQEQYDMLSELVLCCGVGDLEALQMLDAEPPPNSEQKP